jgi:hypothetical protein
MLVLIIGNQTIVKESGVSTFSKVKFKKYLSQ